MSEFALVSVAHPTGATHAKEMIGRLRQLGVLGRFYTLLSVPGSLIQSRWLPTPLRKELARRGFGLPRSKVTSFPFIELAVTGLERFNFAKFIIDIPLIYRSSLMNKYFDWRLSKALGSDRSSVFYGYIGSCNRSIALARNKGKFCILEVTSPLHSTDQDIFRKDAEQNPQWTWLLPRNTEDSGVVEEQLSALYCADLIVVPSAFVKRSIPADLHDRVKLVPYSLRESGDRSLPRDTFTPPSSPLKVLFVGGITQRKGISLLAEMTHALGPKVELTVVGRMSIRGNHDVCRLTGASAWHPSLPNSEVKKLMASSDVLVLPSISDAFGLVVLEAMALGTPVVVSDHVGAAELVEEGKSGFVFPSGSAEAFVNILGMLADDRGQLPRLSESAKRAIRRLTLTDPMKSFAIEIAHLAAPSR